MLKVLKNKILVKADFLFVLSLFVSISCFLLISYTTVLAEEQQTWIKIEENSFAKDGKAFKFIGASAVNLVFYDDWNLDLEKVIRTAKENNVSVLRLYLDWGWGKDEDYDKIIDLASRYGIYVILALTDCCSSSDYSSFEKYLQVRAPYCNVLNRQATTVFKRRIKQILERKNSINGRIYLKDPSILAWEIANELEYWHFPYPQVQSWVRELAAYIKSIDSNHLLTISISTDNAEFDSDTQSYALFDIEGVDFISFHYYPHFEISSSGEAIVTNNYIKQISLRTKNFLARGKPVILGEFGFTNSADLNYRSKINPHSKAIYSSVFKESMDAAFSGGASGVMFWGWGIPEENNIPMWWSHESHSTADENICVLIKGYKIPGIINDKHRSP